MSLPRGRRSQHFEPFEPSLSDEIRVKTGLGAHGNRILYTLRWYSCKVGEELFFLQISCKFPHDWKISMHVFLVPALTFRRLLRQCWRLGVFSGSHGSALTSVPKR